MIEEIHKPIESRCVLCGSCASSYKFTIENVDIVRCNNCTLVYSDCLNQGSWQHMGKYDSEYYQSTQYRGGYQDYEAEAISHKRTFKQRLINAQRRLGSVGTLLDLGCAFGHLGQVAQQLGWQTFSTDISIYAASRAYQKSGQNVYVSDISRPSLRYGYVDLICLYDVIEHLPNPVATLRQVHPLLKPSGMIHISTPDVESVSARLMGNSWYHYKAQEHICYFSRRTMGKALSKAGFDIVDIGPLPSYMTIQEIFRRLRFYSLQGANTLLRLFRWLSIHDKVVKVYVGEIEAWARAC